MRGLIGRTNDDLVFRFRGMESIGDLVNEQKWLKPVETALGATAEVALNQKNPVAQKVRNFLHGTWLGHPLHPVITDVPLGAWTVSTMLDLYELSTGDETFSPGADAAVGIGLIGAGAAAVAGLNDWQFTNDKPKRVGALHAILNIGATLCYLGAGFSAATDSAVKGSSPDWRIFVIAAGAYLGGHLVFKEKIGVNHAPQELPSKFTPVMDEEDLPEGKLKRAKADDIPIVLCGRAAEFLRWRTNARTWAARYRKGNSRECACDVPGMGRSFRSKTDRD